ncbi:selenium metabolism-associated LysR family transcriptional regulator [Desulfosarcina sp.]|uniref:selenium metabolism-associated LysR family transcriptional regulator n=1 Tax=Desulfosarcina sp. TaxID=2027861 RepID=UPI0029B3341D|nr:selenium metabolism-associated LysR family transcriptional regulator [Desulfosarcina sp.]MDX2454711.1 selenium metabolism-associated LysR family transcriptional regulator [Desulfosarcina sp.]MDX2492324.1 selenium metabolism-associated LysR family transcriptional regulator [Desulfosarcina sp.]
MDLWQLQIFCKVVDLKSFSRAGRAVHLSQPTVSSHIKDLEDHFDCRLIDRLSKEALPTQAGRLLYRYAKRMIALRDEADSAMAAFMGQVKGSLNLGGSTIPGAFVLPAIIGAFTSRFPDVNVNLSIADTRQIIEAILCGDLEMGVVGAVSTNKSILQTHLVEDEMCLVVATDHRWSERKRVTTKQLYTEPFIIREPGSGTLKSIQTSFSEAGLNFNELKVVARIGSTEAIRQAIKSRMGVSILSAIAVSDDVAAGKLKTLPIDGLNLKRAFYLTRHRRRSLSPLCQAFIAFINNQIPTQQA